MLRLFRTVRRGLLTGDSVRKYVLYALGEIVLVVVGILIALQIGAWAQDRDREARVRAILVEIREDLIADARDLTRVVPRQFERDSLRAYVLSGEATRADFEARPYGRVYDLPFAFEAFKPRRNGWDRLLAVEGEFPERYADLRSTLNALFVQLHNTFELEERIAEEEGLARAQWLVDNTEWSWRFGLRNDEGEPPLPSEVIDWFYEGHRYRNWLEQMGLRRGELFDALYVQSLAAWAAIGWEIGARVDDPLVPDGLLVDDARLIQPLLGRWIGPGGWGSSEFVVMSGVLYQRNGRALYPFFRSGPDSWQPFYQDPADRSTYRLRVDDDGETVLVRESPPSANQEQVIFRKIGP